MRALLVATALLLTACQGPEGRKEKGAPMPGAGVRLVRGAQELVGSAAFCSRPATVGRDKVEQATPEAKELQRDAVPLGSARYRLIRSRMNSRIVRVCTEVARDEGRDLVVCVGDIADARGLQVQDLTALVLAAMRDER